MLNILMQDFGLQCEGPCPDVAALAQRDPGEGGTVMQDIIKARVNSLQDAKRS